MKILVRVHPCSARQKLLRNPDNSWEAYLTERPEKGQANRALLKLLAAEFNLPKSNLEISHGVKAKVKLIQVNPTSGHMGRVKRR